MPNKRYTFSIAHQPLQLTYSLEIEQRVTEDSDGVPGTQTYDVLGGGYYPDYTVFPLVIQPNVMVYDPDGEIEGADSRTGLVDITAAVGNVNWYELTPEGPVQITNTSTDYEVVTTGSQMGRIRIKKNSSPSQPLSLRYEAQYLDPRTGLDIYPVRMEFSIKCSVSAKPCTLNLDMPGQHFYNPYKPGKQTIHASIYSGGNPVQAGMCKCIWLIRNGLNWEEPQSKPELMFAKVSEDTMSIEVDMEFMGNDSIIRCYGIVSEDPEQLADKTVADAFRSHRVRLTRRLPRFNADIGAMPRYIKRDQKEIYPKAMLAFHGNVTNPEKEVSIKWKTALGTQQGSPSLTEVATGSTPVIPADKVAASYGQILEMNVQDRGPWCILTDGSGRVITDGNGNMIMVR